MTFSLIPADMNYLNEQDRFGQVARTVESDPRAGQQGMERLD